MQVRIDSRIFVIYSKHARTKKYHIEGVGFQTLCGKSFRYIVEEKVSRHSPHICPDCARRQASK